MIFIFVAILFLFFCFSFFGNSPHFLHFGHVLGDHEVPAGDIGHQPATLEGFLQPVMLKRIQHFTLHHYRVHGVAPT